MEVSKLTAREIIRNEQRPLGTPAITPVQKQIMPIQQFRQKQQFNQLYGSYQQGIDVYNQEVQQYAGAITQWQPEEQRLLERQHVTESGKVLAERSSKLGSFLGSKSQQYAELSKMPDEIAKMRESLIREEQRTGSGRAYNVEAEIFTKERADVVGMLEKPNPYADVSTEMGQYQQEFGQLKARGSEYAQYLQGEDLSSFQTSLAQLDKENQSIMEAQRAQSDYFASLSGMKTASGVSELDILYSPTYTREYTNDKLTKVYTKAKTPAGEFESYTLTLSPEGAPIQEVQRDYYVKSKESGGGRKVVNYDIAPMRIVDYSQEGFIQNLQSFKVITTYRDRSSKQQAVVPRFTEQWDKGLRLSRVNMSYVPGKLTGDQRGGFVLGSTTASIGGIKTQNFEFTGQQIAMSRTAPKPMFAAMKSIKY